ncbi:hypothetical protein AB1A81_10295 [Bdellovibrio bacteriovorus]|uniref:Uncharacterized protein n=1 Tax=Bdellovibrio bacteriovorus (strain ATCC 15356 / DSM 50701 / NCIMB 9529 / HD100) TaxID=264462 RepID=Q6MKX8_BDEBA|nr:hypothetical protein [Bdellovibrio bacteriovorus]AHZ84783.1 hypothetical protein EP01_07500 [Bdellovibrio bacteriovorus]BEV68669.1 hypothetical protein Bb109J_c2089 [Bdellovibrio bacteriovorus]CAE80079.1 hypothetical protein predicted by Glimmer/Critica [Bdellovibrio bacteriovorus HD100]
MAAEYAGNSSTHYGSPKQRRPTTPTHKPSLAESSPLSFSNIYQQAGGILESGRKYAVKHPYQIILGAVSVAGVGALAAYILKRRH